MSRAYRIRVSESVTKVVHVKDGVKTNLEVLNVLPDGRMADILEAELKEHGFERQGNLLVRTEDDGVEVTVDPVSGAVTIGMSKDVDIDLQKKRTGRSYRPADAKAKKRLQEELKRDLERDADKMSEEARQKITAHLESRLGGLRQELDQISSKATRDALKERAAQLGDIQEISEDEESGSLTIRVRV